MGEPISESAHYEVRDGMDLFLIQEGRLEAPGVVPILWDRRAEPEPAGVPSPGALRAAGRRAARILSRVF